MNNPLIIFISVHRQTPVYGGAVTAGIGADEGRERLLHQLGERVKELTALHSTASIFQQPKPIADLLQEIASILPPAWQYPEITTARITYDGQEYRTRGFRESPWRQVAGFVTSDGKTGSIDVFYVEEKPPEAEGPFLAEERNLINSLAEMLHIYLDRKLASDGLLESEERFRITFEQAAVGIIHVAPDGRILRANRKFCDIIGYSYDEIIERTLQDITCIHDVPSEAENRDKLMASRIHAYAIEKRNIRKDGKPVWVNETVSLVRLPSGEPGYFIIVLEDITDRKQSESERRRLVHDMQERVKELTAMYRTMEILQQRKPVPELLQEVVAILPDAWQYPEITAARIRFDDRDYVTPNYVVRVAAEGALRDLRCVRRLHRGGLPRRAAGRGRGAVPGRRAEPHRVAGTGPQGVPGPPEGGKRPGREREPVPHAGRRRPRHGLHEGRRRPVHLLQPLRGGHPGRRPRRSSSGNGTPTSTARTWPPGTTRTRRRPESSDCRSISRSSPGSRAGACGRPTGWCRSRATTGR